MKVLFLLVCTVALWCQNTAWSQAEKKSHLYLGVGLPTHPDMLINEKNLLLSVSYRHNTFESFNWAVFLHRASANSELDFFNDNARLLEYIRASGRDIGFDWDRITTYAMGARIHYVFINRPRHFFSFAIGGGFYTSNSTRQYLKRVGITNIVNDDGEVIDSVVENFDRAYDERRKTEPFIMPSFHYDYIFKNDFVVGVELNSLFDQDSEGVTTHPVLANYYSISLRLGKRF